MVALRGSLALLAAAAGLAACGGGAPSAGPAPPAPAPEARGRVLVRISYGSEKDRLIKDSIAGFERVHPTTASGAEITIEALAEVATETMEQVLAGQRTDVSVWWPASSLQADLFDDRWAAAHQGRHLIAESTSISRSPVVLALWEPLARAMGRPEIPVGWKDVERLARAPEGWTKYGQPQWGRFRLGHAHPDYSASGLIALVAMTYAGAGKRADLTVGDVERAAPFVRSLEASVVHYGRSTALLSDQMFTRGPAYLSAAFLYENLVVESHLDARYRDIAYPVVALYPSDGTLWADHPYAVLDLPGTTPEVRDAARRFRDFLLRGERQQIALRSFGFRPADPRAPLSAPFDASHGIDPAEPKAVLSNPPVYVTQAILESFGRLKLPVSITLVLDVSASMAGEALDAAKAGARALLESLPDDDRVRLLFVSGTARWHSEQPEPLAAARPGLAAAIDAARAGGGDALYDAIVEAGRPFPADPSGTRRVVIVLTDGRDNLSRTDLDALLTHLGTGGASGTTGPRVYTVAYGAQADRTILQRIAAASGGEFLAGLPKDVDALADRITTLY